MLKLKNNPELKDFQEYVTNLEIERGFEKETVLEETLDLNNLEGKINIKEINCK